MWLVFRRQVAKFQTLTTLSHPADTITGLVAEGEKRTVDTQSV